MEDFRRTIEDLASVEAAVAVAVAPGALVLVAAAAVVVVGAAAAAAAARHNVVGWWQLDSLHLARAGKNTEKSPQLVWNTGTCERELADTVAAARKIGMPFRNYLTHQSLSFPSTLERTNPHQKDYEPYRK
jgi:hypothetical protein